MRNTSFASSFKDLSNETLVQLWVEIDLVLGMCMVMVGCSPLLALNEGVVTTGGVSLVAVLVYTSCGRLGKVGSCQSESSSYPFLKLLQRLMVFL